MLEFDNYPRVFIASSTEAFGIAYNLQKVLTTGHRQHCKAVLWTEIFEPGNITLPVLVKASKEFDLGIMILAPDDQVNKRGQTSAAVRDNVLFEAGLFMGSLGPERVVLLRITNDGMHLLTDLSGLVLAYLDWEGNYERPDARAERQIYDTNMQIALRKSVCPQINNVLDSKGKRSLRVPLNKISEAVAHLEITHRSASLECALNKTYLVPGRSIQSLYIPF